MEMNTRLQVEHPVTEEITGQDLVEWQLRVASGEPLPCTQDELRINGWAIEARLYAEDPARDFLPSVGRLDHFDLGHQGRIETGVEEGDEVSPFYDPMIAKLIARGDDRDEAIAGLADMLDEIEVWPVRTNSGFLFNALLHPAFGAGDIDTGFIARELDALVPDPVTGRPAQPLDMPGRREEIVLGILRVHTDLHCVAVNPDVRLSEPEWLTGGDPDLVGDKVTTCHELRDRVLDLEPRVHLEERERATVVEQELARPGALVADGARQGERRVAHALAKGRVHRRRARLLEDLLVAPLERAIALAEMDTVAVSIEQHLDLDVAGTLEESLEDQPVVAECRLRLAARSGELGGESVEVPDRPHPLAAAAGGRLDEEWNADGRRGGRQRVIRLVGIVVARRCRNAELGCQAPSGGLVAHRPDSARWRTDPRDAGIDDVLGEVGVLGQEPEARVDRVGTGGACRVDDGGGVEQVQRVFAGCRRSDRADADALARSRDAHGNLATVGNEQRAYRRGSFRAPADRHGDTGERVNRVTCDTPPTTHASSGKPSGRNPPLHGPCRGTDPGGHLARA
jgi:hypothetical protein